MKLKKLKGIAHDLAHHLSFEIWFGDLKDTPHKIDSNVLEKETHLDRECVDFFKERLPKSFDFKRIKQIQLSIYRTLASLSIKIIVSVDNTEFKYESQSMMV